MTIPTPANPAAPAVAGRFRIARYECGRPVSLDAWRLTTNNIHAADGVHALLGGSAPNAWATDTKDHLEVLTASANLNIVIDGAHSLVRHYIRRTTPVWVSTGGRIIHADGSRTPDPDAAMTFVERRHRAPDTGEQYCTSIYFRLAAAPELGTFLFRSFSWDLAERMRRAGSYEALKAAGTNVPATLRLARTPLGKPSRSFNVAAVDLLIDA